MTSNPPVNQCAGQTVNILDYITTENISVSPLLYNFNVNGVSTSNNITTLIPGNIISVYYDKWITNNNEYKRIPNNIIPPTWTIQDIQMKILLNLVVVLI